MEKNSPLILSITGWSGSGKTTFCEKLIIELISRGMRVAAAKNSHQNIETDKPGSDSKRFFDAGAEAVCLNAENSLTIFYPRPLDSDSQLSLLFPDADIIIAEGFKAGGAFRIEITGMIEDKEEIKNPASEVDLIIYGNDDLPASFQTIPDALFIHRDSISKAADIICSHS